MADFVTVQVQCDLELNDVIIAQLFELGFDAFQELEDGFEASIEAASYQEEEVKKVLNDWNVSFTLKEEAKVNWNEEWEKNYQPIRVGADIYVRASFHAPQPAIPYEIVVTPKMSFGTGHHDTTYQMLDYQLQVDHQGKKVLDVGTGTGILAIMAAKLGATQLMATDIDDWSIANSIENFELNKVSGVEVRKAEIEAVDYFDCDIILANINKNVLLHQLKSYSERLKDSGILLLSGFYQSDVEDLDREAHQHQLIRKASTTRNNWAMVAYEKK